MRICRFDDNRLGVVTAAESTTSQRRLSNFPSGPIRYRYSIRLSPIFQNFGRSWNSDLRNPSPNPLMAFVCSVQ